MPWQVSLLFTTLLIIAGFVFKKSKMLWSIQILWMWILMAGSNGGVDWTTHNNIFYSSLSFKVFDDSWLYKLFCYPFVKNGYDFATFNLVISTVLLIILFGIIKRNSKNICAVTSLIYIFPLADSIIQKRNFCALIIFLLGIFPLLKSEKKSSIKFCIFTFLAAQVHSSYYLYFLILPLMKLDYEKLNKAIVFFLMGAFIAIPFIPKIAMIFVPAAKVNFYFSTLKIPLYQSICWWSLQLIFTYLFLKEFDINSKLMKYLKIEEDINEKSEYSKLKQFNKILLIFMPLYYYEPTFFRFFRNMLFVNYIYISKIFDKTEKNYKDVIMVFGSIVCFALLVFLSQFVLFGKGFDYLGVPIFEANRFIGK